VRLNLARSIAGRALRSQSPFNPDIDPLNSCAADDDATAADPATADFVFRPNCLDIRSPPLMRTLLTPDAVPEFNLKQIDDSSLCFGWFTHREQRKVARSIPVAISASQRVRAPTLQGQRSVAWRTELTQDSPRLAHRRNERIRFKLSRKLTGAS
jgi:hypothetical protein